MSTARPSQPWPPHALVGIRYDLDQLERSVRNRPDGRTDEEHIWLTRFLAVRVCGYLEQVVFEVVIAYIHEKSGGPVRAFALSWLGRSQNPSPGNIETILGRFDLRLQEEFQRFIDTDDQRLRRELQFLLDRRHKIAHGLNEGLTPTKALALKCDIAAIADWFFQHMRPS